MCFIYSFKYFALTTRGVRGTKKPQFSRFLARLLEPCWLHFSLLGASWAHSLSLAALVVALRRFLCVLGRSGLDFGGFRPGFGRVFGWFFGLKIHAKGNLKKIV